MKALNENMLRKFRNDLKDDKNVRTLQAAMSKTELKDLAYLPQQAAKLDGPFTIELKTRGITAQQKSGRCWCFAGLNILREIVAEKLGLEEFKLSPNYLTFYDKLEKANTFLESVIENADQDLTSRITEYLKRGIWDGGYWDMVVDLVKKYGVVPAEVMPETYQSNHTDTFMKLMNRMLKKDAVLLRQAVAEGKDVTAMKEEMLGEIYKAECIVFGEPVESFDFTYRDKDGAYHADYALTPKAFYEKYIGASLEDYVTIVNTPTFLVPMNTAFTFHYIGSMAESRVFCLNVPLEDMKALAIAQLKDGEPIWFGCDSGQFGDRQLGIWDPDSFDYEGLLGGVDLTMSKKDCLEFDEAGATHAMLFVGVNFDQNGKTDRWKIENSWGGEVGRKGYFVCSDRYFDEYVFEVIINKKHLTDAQKEALNKEPVQVAPWLAY